MVRFQSMKDPVAFPDHRRPQKGDNVGLVYKCVQVLFCNRLCSICRKRSGKLLGLTAQKEFGTKGSLKELNEAVSTVHCKSLGGEESGIETDNREQIVCHRAARRVRSEQ